MTRIFFVLSLLLPLSACITLNPSYTQHQIRIESEKIDQFFERVFSERLSRSPMRQTGLGIKTDYDKLDDLSEGAEIKELEYTKSYLQELKTFNFDMLDEQSQLSYRLFQFRQQQTIDNWKWRHHDYPINQMHGLQSNLPAFFISEHQVKSVKDAEDYIARLNHVPKMFDQQISQLKIREKKGIIPPNFVFPLVLSDCRNVIKDYPFTNSKKFSPLFKDLTDKINKLKISKRQKKSLISRGKKALTRSIFPAYSKLITYLTQLEKISTTDDGVWKLPEGNKFYSAALKKMTTTEMSAKEIHDLGLSEVSRIHAEMKKLMKTVKSQGSLQDFFQYTRNDKKFYFQNNSRGRKKYLKLATNYIATMKSKLPLMFDVQPKADIEVKPVEAFRAKSAGKAFYSRSTPDGSRPGVYYINLYDMSKVTSFEAEALAYHEGIPGHHMQIAISSELQNIPKFRKFGWYTAYGEGWGLYSEYLPKEYGFYSDPYSDFGRLTMELWRACRLVVDTGIHSKKWTRNQAIKYLVENTPNPKLDIVKAIERYIIMPGQATAYKIGMLEILRLRESAKEKLGAKFDIRKFHNVVLKGGPVPLNILEEQVHRWVKSQ